MVYIYRDPSIPPTSAIKKSQFNFILYELLLGFPFIVSIYYKFYKVIFFFVNYKFPDKIKSQHLSQMMLAK